MAGDHGAPEARQTPHTNSMDCIESYTGKNKRSQGANPNAFSLAETTPRTFRELCLNQTSHLSCIISFTVFHCSSKKNILKAGFH